MLRKGNIIILSFIISPFLRCGFLYVETDSTVQNFNYRYRFQHTNDVYPFIVYCVTRFETIFCGLIL